MTNTAEIMTSYDYVYDDKIVKVSLLWLIQNLVSSCDFSMDECLDEDLELLELIMQNKTSDGGMGYLIESIQDRGFQEGGAIGAQWHDGVHITEGHHRLCAAILLGLDEVYISSWGSNYEVDGRKLSAHSAYDYRLGAYLPEHPIILD